MDKMSFEEIPVANGAEAFLEQLKAAGSVRYLFANTGTDHGPLIEALAKSEREGAQGLRAVLVPHEQAAVSMAHGYYNVTHEPQAVLVHTLPGTANALGGLINASSSNVPVILVAGRTPVTEGELLGGKNRNIHWRQESRDQGALVREFVKWDYEHRSNKNIGTVVSRAFNVAMTEPRGPVYLALPREWLCEPLESTRVNKGAFKPATKIQAETATLEKAAELLLSAREPLIVTKYLGRNPEAVDHLVRLAELFAIPVVQHPWYMNFPSDHPLYLGQEPLKYAKRCDVIFLIDVDVPWNNTSRDILKPDARIIQLEVDPLFSSIPIWGFPVDLAITGCSEISLPVLNDILERKLKEKPEAKRACDERRKRIQSEHHALKKEIESTIESVRKRKPMHPLWVSRCIGAVMDEETTIICETVTSPLAECIDLRRPGSFFTTPPAGHLGWGVGAAIGAKLGAPDQTVIAATGDGAYIFSAPTACHFTAHKYGIPFLTVVYNNQAWNASLQTVKSLYPSGTAEKTHNFPGCDLSPSPLFELTAQACGAHAERVEEPDQLQAALERALRVVRDERRQALLNVICESPV